MSTNQSLHKSVNYLLPAVGMPRMYTVHGEVSDEETFINFRDLGLDGVPFSPYGVYANNKGNYPVTIEIVEIGFTFTVPAQSNIQMPYPAPVQQSVKLRAENPTEIEFVFVEYPVQPSGGANGGGGGGGGGDVDLSMVGTIDDAPAFNPVGPGTVIANLKMMNMVTQSVGNFIQTISGSLGDKAFDGAALPPYNDASVISLLKRACILLDDIKTNTTP